MIKHVREGLENMDKDKRCLKSLGRLKGTDRIFKMKNTVSKIKKQNLNIELKCD